MVQYNWTDKCEIQKYGLVKKFAKINDVLFI